MQDFLRDVVFSAGALSLEYRRRLGELEVSHKSKRDMVSEADIAVEEYIVGRINKEYPGHGVLGEEGGEHGCGQYRWIIDPIDGTTSFLRGQPFYSISIAVEKDGEVILGAVNAPVLGELFTAAKGGGAFLNDQPIKVSKVKELAGCVLATGFACMRYEKERNNMPYFAKIMPLITGIRRCGSAAIDMCYTACGRLDGFWELNLNIYDLAAGILIAEEAGGMVSDFSGAAVSDYKEIVCTNGLVHGELVGIIANVKIKS